MSQLRSRIYERYVTARRGQESADESYALRAPYLRRLVRHHFPADRSGAVIDLGCGDGALMHFAREAGYRSVRGVDCSPEQVERATSRGLDVGLGDVTSFMRAEPPGAARLVVTLDLVEHLTRQEYLDLADQVLRVLEPGGCWLLHVPNAESPFFGRVRYGDITHESAFTAASLQQSLVTCGFLDVRCTEDKPVVHGVKSALRRGAWLVIRSMLRTYLAAETGQTDGIFSQNLLAVARKGPVQD